MLYIQCDAWLHRVKRCCLPNLPGSNFSSTRLQPKWYLSSKANNNAYQMHKVLYELKCKLYINPSSGALIFPKENEVRRTKRRGRRGGAFKTLSRHYKQSWQPKSPWWRAFCKLWPAIWVLQLFLHVIRKVDDPNKQCHKQ